MPVCSYVVHPVPGKKQQLVSRLEELPWSEVIPADNRDLILLVTDTVNQDEESIIQNQIKNIQEIQIITLTFGEINPRLPQETAHAS